MQRKERASLKVSWCEFLVMVMVGTWCGEFQFAFAQPMPESDIPPVLRPWIPWVLDEVPDWGCAEREGMKGEKIEG
ncbi:MAG: hypothetical protein RMJ84_10065, partial [Sandaracinaceae bacterium]|nr:hypothetical protein [Sandaracinaceae bacterium]